MNIPNTMMIKAINRFGAMRSEAGLPIMAGEAVVAFAMVSARVQASGEVGAPLPLAGEVDAFEERGG